MPGADLFQIDARDGSARAGVLRLAHGEVRTPAFVPLASTATVKTLHSAEVEALGYEMVLGNTFHLFIQPGHEQIAELGGLHEFMGWRRPIITDSGGFQVFSMGHGSVAEEIKRSRRRGRSRASSRSRRRACASAPTSTAPSASWGPRPRWRSRRRSARTSRSPSTSARRSTSSATTPRARWSARTAGSTAASPGTTSTRRRARLLFGIVQGGVYEDLRAESAARVAAAPVPGVAIGGSLGQEKEEMREVVGWALRGAARRAAAPPARDRRRRRHPARRGRRDRQLRLRHADAARPPRHRAGARPRQPLAARPDEAGRRARAASRSPRAARAPPAASTRAATSTTWRGRAS